MNSSFREGSEHRVTVPERRTITIPGSIRLVWICSCTTTLLLLKRIYPIEARKTSARRGQLPVHYISCPILPRLDTDRRIVRRPALWSRPRTDVGRGLMERVDGVLPAMKAANQ